MGKAEWVETESLMCLLCFFELEDKVGENGYEKRSTDDEWAPELVKRAGVA